MKISSDLIVGKVCVFSVMMNWNLLDHLILRCPLIKSIWFLSNWQLTLEPFGSSDARRWFGELLNPESQLTNSEDLRIKLLNFAIVAF